MAKRSEKAIDPEVIGVQGVDIHTTDEDELTSAELLVLARKASGVSHLTAGPGEEARLMTLRQVALAREAK